LRAVFGPSRLANYDLYFQVAGSQIVSIEIYIGRSKRWRYPSRIHATGATIRYTTCAASPGSKPGQHDYPQFLADWSKILTEHGAVVDGSLHAPSAAELEHTDVIVMYKGDAGYMSDDEKAALEAFVKRGGGIVSLHDSLCGPDPAYFATLVGGAKKHGEVNYTLDADIPYTVTDHENPIMRGVPNLTIVDEAFFNMTWATNPGIHVLATAVIPGTPSAGAHKGEVAPQIWTYEHTLPGGQPARAFVWMQGHIYANFANPQLQAMLLRGIAWAGKRPVDELVDYKPPAPAAPKQ
jgi:type 1 glutamine amidotransferase